MVVVRDRLSAALLAALAVAWVVLGLDVVSGTAATFVGNTALVLVGAVVGLRQRTRVDRVVTDMVMELGQDDRPASPLSASLAEALGDPALRIAVFEPGAGWRDDAGLPVQPPDLEESAAGSPWRRSRVVGRWCWCTARTGSATPTSRQPRPARWCSCCSGFG